MHKFHFYITNTFWDTDRFTQIWCFFSLIFSFHEMFAFYDEILQNLCVFSIFMYDVRYGVYDVIIDTWLSLK